MTDNDRTLSREEIAALRARQDHHASDRAAAVNDTAAAEPPSGPGLGSIVAHGAATLAASALALAVASGVLFFQAAQADTVATERQTGAGLPDTSQAVPNAAEQNRRPEGAHVNDDLPGGAGSSDDDSLDNGSLDVFDRSASDASSDEVRRELDRALDGRRAAKRDTTLGETNEQAQHASDGAVVDARHTRLVNAAEATRREQARLEEEKRKAEQALAAQRRARTVAQANDPGLMPMPRGAGSNVGSTAVGNGATPMPRGAYSVGARWGAVGSWSRYHTGIDLRAPIGTPIHATADGVVVPANGGGWAGTHVVIRHADGSATLYAHMSGTTVNPGQTVKAGQVIGAVGMTGRTFGPHLHFEHYPQASTVGNPYTTDDPYQWMLTLGVRL